MIQPEKQPSPENLPKVLRAMQIVMRNYAFHQFDHIDPRTFVALQDLDLLDEPANSIGTDIDLGILRNPNHPLRIELPPGPILLCMNNEKEPKRVVIEVPVLLYSELPEVRKTALSYLDELIAGGTLLITPKTQAALKRSQAKIVSDTSHEWRQAAIELNDAFNDDILIALHVVKQCLRCGSVLQDTLNTYVPRVMHPAVSSLDSIALEVRNPEKEHPKLMEIVSSIVETSASLSDACERYYASLGHVPLASPYSMGEIVNLWMMKQPKTNAWAEVWNWANDSFGPVPRYHACSAFILHPELIPEGKLPDLWRQILDVVIVSDSKDFMNPGHALWGLRRDLIRHFTCHLEAHLPNNDGDSIANFAWWLTERVARIFPDKPESAQFYRKNWVGPAVAKSAHIWLAATPRIGSSSLRHATATVPFPWAMALLALMGNRFEKLGFEKQTDVIQSSFRDVFVSSMISALPVVVEPPSDPTYAMEYPLGETALKLALHQPEEMRKVFEQIVSSSRTLASAKELISALRKLTDHPVADQSAVALALKSIVFKDPAAVVGAWDVLADGEWRQRVFCSVDDQVLGLLIEAFSVLQVHDREKWIYLLPHYLAEACEKADNEERQRQLFMYVLHTSLISDTVSAVRRLLRGSQKTKFGQFADDYRALVENLWPYYPTWVRGRLRGLLASLRVV